MARLRWPGGAGTMALPQSSVANAMNLYHQPLAGHAHRSAGPGLAA
ncbi:hypothetical protein ACFFTM_12385 [Pseudoduganella plicata]|nr:hypothetical protein [Pseudoduganella plicata]